ncbi:MAG TPA: carbohydrate kinase family protein [Candidatus Acidoferrales bacterium]|nr:carbohydrate kinase family protein [Candidatus Acidoferrales bacterium]
MTGPSAKPRVLVLGDLMLDVVLAAARPIESGTDVPGRVEIRQGGSAANTARWLGRLGVATQLVCSIGRDGAGRSLVLQLERDDVTVHARRIAGSRTGRIGVLVAPGGERSFVADRRAADLLAPEDLQDVWFQRLDLVHLPIYSLLGEPLGRAGMRAIGLARAHGALVSLDLASIGPMLAEGRRAARELVAGARPDLLFATEPEAQALLGRHAPDGLLELAEVVVIKLGDRGARVVARRPAREDEDPATPQSLAFDVATPALPAKDTTGAGDAFDAGFIAGWLTARAAARPLADALHRATLQGHRTAARHLGTPRVELPAG